MSRTRSIVIVTVLLLVATGVVPSSATADSTLSVDVDQGRHGAVAVTVTSNGTAVENAEVTVEGENATYAGEGTHETDANGTVDLPAPNETVTVDVTVTDGNQTGSTTTTLYAPTLDVEADQAPDGRADVAVTYSITGDPATGATVNVSTADENDTYEGEGVHTTDENGSVTLPAPEETVAIKLDAVAGPTEGSASVLLQNQTAVAENYETFGAQVSAFVHSVLGGSDDGIGRIVADFVTSNNPGNAPDHAGPPDDGDRGPPDAVGSQAGNSTSNGGAPGEAGGPPDHAQNDAGEDGRSDGDGNPGQGQARGR